jgi:hypothetical protein
MSFAIVHHFPGGTQAQYEAVIAAVHPGDGRLPDGQVFHAAGPSAGGWTVIRVFDSQESWERLRDGLVAPRIEAQGGIKGGFTTPPQQTLIDVYTLLP